MLNEDKKINDIARGRLSGGEEEVGENTQKEEVRDDEETGGEETCQICNGLGYLTSEAQNQAGNIVGSDDRKCECQYTEPYDERI